METRKTLGKIAIRTLKWLLAIFAAAGFVFCAWLAKEVYFSAYEPRGFVSEYDKDVSQFFPAWTLEAEDDIVEPFQKTLDATAALDVVEALSEGRIYFDLGKISGWQFYFTMKNIKPFRGTLEVSSTGHAAETYVHRHFAGSARPMKKEDALRQLSDIRRQADEIGFAVSHVLVSAGKNAYYDGNGELLREYSYE